MEEQAIYIGLSLHYFWSLNPKQWKKHIEVFEKKEKERIQDQDYLNFLLGQYIGIAFNDPKEYPKIPFTAQSTKKKEMTDDEMERQALRNTMIMGGVINDN